MIVLTRRGSLFFLTVACQADFFFGWIDGGPGSLWPSLAFGGIFLRNPSETGTRPEGVGESKGCCLCSEDMARLVFSPPGFGLGQTGPADEIEPILDRRGGQILHDLLREEGVF